MKNIHSFLLPLLAACGVALLLSACHKDDPAPPPPPPEDYTKLLPETQEGKNTFGCLVSGKVWRPRVPIGAITYRAIDALLSEKNGKGNGGIACTWADKTNDEVIELSFGATNFEAIELHPSKKFNAPKVSSFFKRFSTYYELDIKDSLFNKITITKIDTAQNIISGRFQFKYHRDTDPNQEIIVTDGRFDLKYTPQ